MVKRRSLNDVLNADEHAFLKQGTSKSPAIKKPKVTPTEHKETAMPQPVVQEEDVIPAAALVPPSTKTVASGQPLSIHARIDPTITTALLRASFERRLQQQVPWMQRDIIAEALVEWLRKKGFLN